uniref:Uncharacterized protein n=1 Tax=Rhizophora mucronata TaxID=61149 RepID=A0A2P2R329_RHIMU
MFSSLASKFHFRGGKGLALLLALGLHIPSRLFKDLCNYW